MHLRCRRRDVPGHVVNTKRINACQEKAEAVMKLHSPRTLKEVQSLNGKLTSLSRFLSKSAEKSLPFLKTLKNCMKKSDFQWTAKAEKAFEEMKKHIAELPLLTAPKPKEDLAPEINYKPMEKLILALVHASRRLRRPDEDAPYVETPPEEKVPEPWTLFTDESSCLEGSEAGLIMTNPRGTEFAYALRFKFDASNNEA
ncbi:hypothetical protein Tco_0375784 [Tanacetum coccineum]